MNGIAIDQQERDPFFILRHRALMHWPWLLVILAWTITLIAFLTNQQVFIDHHYLLGRSSLSWPIALIIFLLCWQVMTIAMMLPSSMPLIMIMIGASRHQKRPLATQSLFLLAYLTAWTIFAVGAFVSDLCIHWLVAHWFWLYIHSTLIGAITLALAGLFQFSSLKKSCLKQCRSPLSFFIHHYQPGMRAAWQLGFRHGMFCLGCCWALMLVMFGLGIGSLTLMGILTGIMVIEKTSSQGKHLSYPLGITLLILATLWYLYPIWLNSNGI